MTEKTTPEVIEIEATEIAVSTEPLKDANELIVVEQLPIITQQLQSIKQEIIQRTSYALSLDVTEDNYKEIKKIRSELNASFNELEAKRKEVKKAVLAPYNEFETAFKENVTDVFRPAIAEVGERITAVEDGLKQKKSEEVEAYFVEYAASKNIDFLSFADMDLNINLTVSKKSLKDKIKATIDKVCDDLAMIDTQEYKAEILVEYKKSLNVSQAILTVTNRMKEIEVERQRAEEAARIAAEKAAIENNVDKAIEDSFAPPVVLSTPEAVEMPVADFTEPTECSEMPQADFTEQAQPSRKYVLTFKIETYKERHIAVLKRTLDNLEKDGLKYEQC